MQSQCERIDPENEHERCHRRGRYVMFLTLYGENEKRLVTLCGTHDRDEGRANLMRQGWDREDATAWVLNPDLSPKGVA
jgi:hypothetical protein